MTIANAKPDLLITGPIGTTTVNAASSAWHDYLTVEAKITAAIAYAVSIGAKAVYVPDCFLPYTASLVTFNNAVMMLREGGPPHMLDVIAYGADPTRVADSAVAIQAAMNAAMADAGTNPNTPQFSTAAGTNARTVYFPPGRYAVGTTLSKVVNANQRGVTLRFEGGGYAGQNTGGSNGEPAGWGVQLEYTATSGDFLFLSCGASALNSRIRFLCEGITFIGNKNVGGATSGGGLHFQSLVSTADVHSVLRHVYVLEAKDNGIWIDGTNNCQWFNVQSQQNGARGMLVTDQVGAALSPESHFYALECTSNGSHGLELQNTTGHTAFQGFTANFNTGKALLITGNSGQQRFYNIEAENNVASPVVDLGPGTGTSIVGCQIVYLNTGQVGVSTSGFANAIWGLNTNSGTNQIDLQFLAGASRNVVEGWEPGDNVYSAGPHITDAGNWNIVRAGAQVISGAPQPVAKALTWAASITPFTDQATDFFLTATSNIAATINAPGTAGAPAVTNTLYLNFTIFNNSGGALTTPVAFATGAGAYLTSAGVTPANGTRITVGFKFDQVNNRYIEIYRSAAV